MTHFTSLAQIGVGYWGPNLLRALLREPRCQVARVCDLSASRLAYVSSLNGSIRIGNDVGEIFSDPTIEAVVIATPPNSHHELTLRALDAGKHVLVEKPMACTSQEVKSIGERARKANLVSMVGHTFVYSPAVKVLRHLVSSGALGEIRYIYSQRLNLGRIRSDVDALWNFAPHDLSIIEFVLNSPHAISAHRHGMGYVQEGIQDVVFLNVLYENGIMANIHASWLDPQRVRRMVIVGSKKMVVYDDTSKTPLELIDKGIDRLATLGSQMDYDLAPQQPFHYRSGPSQFPEVSAEEPLRLEIAHFLDCIQLGTPCLTDAAHALRITEILESCG